MSENESLAKFGVITIAIVAVIGLFIANLTGGALWGARPSYGESPSLLFPLLVAIVGSILIFAFFWSKAGGGE